MIKNILITLSVLSTLFTTSAFCADEYDITSINEGTTRYEIHELLGEPVNSSLCNFKEVYELSNGETAILQYQDDILTNGFILIN